jgi:hypothetical protein
MTGWLPHRRYYAPEYAAIKAKEFFFFPATLTLLDASIGIEPISRLPINISKSYNAWNLAPLHPDVHPRCLSEAQYGGLPSFGLAKADSLCHLWIDLVFSTRKARQMIAPYDTGINNGNRDHSNRLKFHMDILSVGL